MKVSGTPAVGRRVQRPNGVLWTRKGLNNKLTNTQKASAARCVKNEHNKTVTWDKAEPSELEGASLSAPGGCGGFKAKP